MINRDELDALSNLVERERDAYLWRSSLKFLECAVNLCATHMPMEALAELLEAQAKMLRDHI